CYSAYLNTVNLSRPREFLPERWLDSGDASFESDRKEMFQLFSYGQRNCIGQNLAWLEMRLLLTKILWHWDLEILPESERWKTLKNYMTLGKGPLMVEVFPVERE
ncbi:cytochrome P450 CYP4/CYP19/CYP26 subfamily, partial [Calycina marina]